MLFRSLRVPGDAHDPSFAVGQCLRTDYPQRKGEVIALYPLMPDRMTVNRDSNGQLYYEYTVSMDDAPTVKGSLVRLNPSDVLHIPGLGFDGLVGYSPIAMAKNAIGMAIACEEYG